MGDMEVRGAEQLADLSRDLKAVGDAKLRREMLAGLRKAGRPLIAEARQAALSGLPRHGGLNQYVASAKFAVRTSTTGKNVGVRIAGTKAKHDLKALDLGRVRHPVFGRWVPGLAPQSIRPGWWSDGLSDDDAVHEARKQILAVLDDVARRLSRG